VSHHGGTGPPRCGVPRRAVALVLATLALVTFPVPSASAGRVAPIAFSRDGDLFTVRPGGGVRRVSASPAREHTPAWSADHHRLAFIAWDRRLVTLDLRTGARRRLMRIGSRYDAIEAVAWAPDGSRIALATSREFRRAGSRRLCGQIWTVAARGGRPTKVLGGQQWVTGLGWTSGGDRLVASTEWPNGVDACRDGVRTGIVSMAPDGSDRTWISKLASQIDVSNDGGWLVYRGWRRTCHACGEIWWRPAGGGHARLIAMPPDGVAGLRQPRFSPDDRRMALLAATGARASIWIMRADGSRLHRLVGGADSIDW
jgi:Tol biopolymer transport system component